MGASLSLRFFCGYACFALQVESMLIYLSKNAQALSMDCTYLLEYIYFYIRASSSGQRHGAVRLLQWQRSPFRLQSGILDLQAKGYKDEGTCKMDGSFLIFQRFAPVLSMSMNYYYYSKALLPRHGWKGTYRVSDTCWIWIQC
ncbi:hypothetical protein GQ55_4G043100 [Panicum hallii var. hallii]|uniref:Uncharacterized protein n=1 Tax=Panicum hallii var. hallii TaxID=1504633 RepID=A0A2T7DV39_9POAL|nr:hypothetical protein GQ55_4G043100 [Panicum hallii var. hallii]